MLVTVVATGIVGSPHRLTQVALAGEGQEGIHRRAGVGDGESSILAAVRGRGRRGPHQRLGQTAQLVLVEVRDVAFLVGQYVVRKRGMQPGQFLVDLRVAVLGLVIEGGAIAREAIVDQPDQALLVGPRGFHLFAAVDRLDAGEQGFVLGNLGVERCQFRRHFLLHLARLRSRTVRPPDSPVGEHAPEVSPGALERQDRVVESRRLGIRGDHIDLVEMYRHADFEGRLEVFDPHPVERRYPSVGTGPLFQKHVLGSPEFNRTMDGFRHGFGRRLCCANGFAHGVSRAGGHQAQRGRK